MYRNADGEREGKVHNQDTSGQTRRVRKAGTKSNLVARQKKIDAAKARKQQGK